jgi:hypothetical protein
MRFLDFAPREAYDAVMTIRVSVAIALMVAGAGGAQAQSLAEVAREEAARRKTVATPGRVYTNNDLRPDFTRPAPPPATPESTSAAGHGAAAAPEAGAAAAGATQGTAQGTAPGAAQGGDLRDQAYWSSRMADARAKVDRSQAFAQALQNRIDMLWTDFVNRGDPVQQRAIEQDRNKALAELETLKREIEANRKAVADIEDEARRAGVPAGWLRP